MAASLASVVSIFSPAARLVSGLLATWTILPMSGNSGGVLHCLGISGAWAVKLVIGEPYGRMLLCALGATIIMSSAGRGRAILKDAVMAGGEDKATPQEDGAVMAEFSPRILPGFFIIGVPIMKNPGKIYKKHSLTRQHDTTYLPIFSYCLFSRGTNLF
eukprot:gene20439-1081_t